jgi:hypothetical protein
LANLSPHLKVFVFIFIDNDGRGSDNFAVIPSLHACDFTFNCYDVIDCLST